MSLERAKQLRRDPTDAEKRLWYFLQAKRIGPYKFRRQQTIGRYVVDFVCFAPRLVIEVDGGQHAAPSVYEERRTMAIEAAGYRVLRFWNNDVLEHTEGVLTVIQNTLHEGPTPLTGPPPQGGR